ncbi:carbamoyltransferase C-terminal domain-containing protein [Tengunoibacter tsumagoiensis]|uniref:Nodulation protein U n=1 Tax=Tengunoibacter tsumagoiensis TaxID=2014871 RepID=A0A402A8Z1_9CHLR|nr:carbamoyltransferase C-terminal domain-containing protein [Tengunoibacter tsumagoiensis]GCE15613.1 nodulation protein U [Tengunoibacter tsumagoiensis]
MKILSFKPGHDGSVAFVEDGKLLFSLEAEKDSFSRYSLITPQVIVQALDLAPSLPDVVAIGGWHKQFSNIYSGIGAGYFGLQPGEVQDGRFFGKPVKVFSSSHERSHLFMSTAMAPIAPLKECIVLVWEGFMGAFYHWQDYGARISRIDVLTQPGFRYSALFALGDPTFSEKGEDTRLEDAGKLMALAGFYDGRDIPKGDQLVIESLLTSKTVFPFDKRVYKETQLYNCGVNTPRMHAAAYYITNRLFEIFFEVAKNRLPQNLPLVISGGCGLNCEWNQRWRASGLFSDVFVPPCTNDTGSAIGTAADAMTHFGEPCRLEWSVYAGAPFLRDIEPDPQVWAKKPLDLTGVAQRLAQDSVFAWVQGGYEMGPRALGHRSLLASPLTSNSKDLLNTIKKRESYRPIAPCSLYEDLEKWFEPAIDDPYMLYFSKVKTPALPAITHVDGTARVQSVKTENEPVLHSLLEAFKAVTGYGVLCNTSLNFKGTGFINRTSELVAYCEEEGITEFVIDDLWYSRSDASKVSNPIHFEQRAEPMRLWGSMGI